ncbi:uncharacterized protein LOC141903910 [Tubulanus polymorphus]|uniref:uncharacterized protein LOC141903910 n=1 Tax=Tubulanus polymorphus TaxID=672921 RepID=UPI003DA402FB
MGKSAKQLAQELGLVKRRSKNSSRQNYRNGGQKFDFVIVLDFESTCWDDRTTKRPQEIIEFPAVLMNTATGEIEDRFQQYVMPEESPILSEFCTNLTGITQEKVENGIPIRSCLSKFSNWLTKISKSKNIVFNRDRIEGRMSCTFVTWSDWDLGVCLLYECKRKQLSKPVSLNCWIDLRATYRQFYQRRPNGLKGAMQDLGLDFEGREHSGIDDAINTANLVMRMIKDGCVMVITKSLDARIASFKPQPLPHSSSLNSVLKSYNSPSKIPVPVKILNQPTPTRSNENLFVDRNNSGKVVENSTKSPAASNKQVNATSRIPVQSPLKMTPEMSKMKSYNKRSERSPTAKKLELSAKRSRIYSPLKSIKGGVSSSSKQSAFKVFVDSDNEKIVERVSNISDMQRNKNNVCLTENIRTHVSSLETPSNRNQLTGTCSNSSNHQSNIKTQMSSFKTPSNQSHIAESCCSSSNNLSNIKTRMSSFKTPASSFKTPASSFKTPVSSFKTPASSVRTPLSNMTNVIGNSFNVTPPLCKCGRRTKRKVVQTPGPNVGRIFYACPTGRSGGCGYFQWETSLREKISSSASPVLTRYLPSHSSFLKTPISSINSSLVRKGLGVRPNTVNHS